MISCIHKNLDEMLYNMVIYGGDESYHFPSKSVAIVYKNCTDFIYLDRKGNPRHTIVKDIKYKKDYIIVKYGTISNTILYSNITIINKKDTIYDNSEINKIRIKEDTVIDSILCCIDRASVQRHSLRRQHRVFKKYIQENFDIPKAYVYIDCPNELVDLYAEIFDNDCWYFTIASATHFVYLNEYVSENFLWAKYVSKLSFDVSKYSLLDEKIGRYRVIETEIAFVSTTTPAIIKICYKSLLEYLRYYLVEYKVVSKKLLPYFKVYDIAFTGDKSLIIKISNKKF